MTKADSVNIAQAMREVIRMAKQADELTHQMDLLAKSVGISLITLRNIMPTVGTKYILIRSGVAKIAEAIGQEPIAEDDTISVKLDDIRIEELID